MSSIDKLKNRLADVNALNSAVAIMDWDQQTYMPSGAAEARAEQCATLSQLIHEMTTGEETGADVAIKGYDDGCAWTSPVGSFKANQYGLYDMGGNVWQWCMDNWNDESKAKVLRGASWVNPACPTLKRLAAEPLPKYPECGTGP